MHILELRRNFALALYYSPDTSRVPYEGWLDGEPIGIIFYDPLAEDISEEGKDYLMAQGIYNIQVVLLPL